MSMATTPSINQDAILNWAITQMSSMATTTTTTTTNGLCQNCHKKPKFGTHRYCGKTCAATQAAAQKPAHPIKASKQKGPPPAAPKPVQSSLCDYCGQKPKFSNFDHCGKSCASKATAGPGPGPGPVGQPAVQAQGRSAPKQGARVPATAQTVPSQAAAVKKSKHTTSHVVPASTIRLAKDDSSEDGDDYFDADEDETGTGTDLDDYPSDDEEEATAPAPLPLPRSVVKGAHATTKKQNAPAAHRVAGTCRIPNCGKPTFVERSGVKTDFCSTRHREDAVALGLVPGCIMCQRYPQSGTDYFCSTACRNQSMMKT